jgi:hypothetical protein
VEETLARMRKDEPFIPVDILDGQPGFQNLKEGPIRRHPPDLSESKLGECLPPW